MPIVFSLVPDNSPLNAYEPYLIIDQTHCGFIYQSQITGQKHEVANSDSYRQMRGE